jgi:pimeloyl-ACP methyl ester carboxylesterase
MKIPLILVSGLLCDESTWAHQVNNLKDLAEIHVICPHQDTPQKMVEEILKPAPDRFALAGHSMGGWLSLEVMRRAPERVTRLCLLNTTAKPDTPAKQAKRHEMIQRAENGQFAKVVDELVSHFVFDAHVIEAVRRMLQKSGAEAFIREEQSMLLRDECLSILPLIHCPTLVVHAEKDQVFSLEDHEELIHHIPKAKLSIVQACGHMSPMEKPQIITDLMRSWLIEKDI